MSRLQGCAKIAPLVVVSQKT